MSNRVKIKLPPLFCLRASRPGRLLLRLVFFYLINCLLLSDTRAVTPLKLVQYDREELSEFLKNKNMAVKSIHHVRRNEAGTRVFISVRQFDGTYNLITVQSNSITSLPV